MLTTVVLDVSETLVDETPQWAAWAQWRGAPAGQSSVSASVSTGPASRAVSSASPGSSSP